MRRDQPYRTNDKGEIVLDAFYSFPGIILHEFAHKWAAERRGLAVRDYTLWNWRNGGHVSHEPATSPGDKIAVAGMPCFVNTVVSVILWALAAVVFASRATPVPRYAELTLAVFLAWLGWSAGKHAIPSPTDAVTVWQAAWRRPSWSYRQAKLRSVATFLVLLSKFKLLNSVFGLFIGIVACFPFFLFYDVTWQLLLGEYLNLIFRIVETAEQFSF